MHPSAYTALASLLCAIALSACAGNGPPSAPTPTPGPSQTPGGSGPTIDTVQTQIFNVSCLTSGCHNAADRAGNLILETGLSWSNLVGVVPENDAAAQAGELRVRRFEPQTSFLIAKLEGPPLGQGSRMPQGGPFLSVSDVDTVRRWILGGARDSEGPTATHPPTASLTPTASVTSTATETASPTITSTPSLTPSGTLAPSATATATASPSPTATIPTVTLAQIQATIFDTSCAVRFCHDAASAQFSGDLNLDAASSYTNLVGISPDDDGVTPDNAAAAAAGLLRVQPFEPDNSFLVLKICRPQFGQQLCPEALPPGYGSPMPLVGRELTPDQVEQIRVWILRGAPETD